MSFQVGDIVQFLSVQTGYPKYHLCVLGLSDEEAAVFLYLNSEDGFAADFVLSNQDIPFLPASRTGKSVISCSQLVRLNKRQIKTFNTKKLGALDKAIVKRLLEFIKATDALSKKDKHLVISSLSKLG